ncbi:MULTISPECIES: hypothetical protein [Acetobacter]|jgi:hypothetical protein|uniref:Uncharacterized protein n=1 Tax=Acetobacter lovaniensis TaxID=104100 RepID=A0A841QB01_9PROT|nr:hypothetical protein [Acetobacter lovaniensis]MBB6455463.1 hypothetical protein [Acetobacter lovaniensis]MCI1697599.1 hypothetical protein [Acetobacter lovaniensis]MCI1796595.1 hypothetical protein [Acetobacter lovaniensis]MCP1238698.1 hypothetical protein [Acetobacter lovaniensis]NHN79870.1 hypothetical protein [Acetobacter lovaniensis]
MIKSTKEFILWFSAFLIVGGIMWGGSKVLNNYRSKQWDQFVLEHHCVITGTQPSTGFFTSAQTIYQCDNTGIYYRNK